MKLYQYGWGGDPPHVFDLDHIVAVLAPYGGNKETLTVHTTSGVLTFDCGGKDQAAKMHQDIWFRWAHREAELAHADNVRNKFFVAATQVCESQEKAREEEAKRRGGTDGCRCTGVQGCDTRA